VPARRADEGALKMAETPTRTQILLAQVAAVLVVTFAMAGIAWYGLSVDVIQRIWRNVIDRPFGPMTFRFFLQPIMAGIAAGVAGVKDARRGRSPYLWTILTHPEKAAGRLHEGLIATSRVILLGLVMDVIYQLTVFETFHPGEAAIIALALAFVPYLLLRGPITRVAAWWLGRRPANGVQ
jgi:hypothetical protein